MRIRLSLGPKGSLEQSLVWSNMGNVDCGEAFREKAGEAAEDLFHLAILLLSDEMEAVEVVEEFVAGLEVNKSADCETSRIRMVQQDGSQTEMFVTKANKHEAQHASKRRLAELSLLRIAKRGVNVLAVPDAAAKCRTRCMDCEDLSSSGISPSEFDDVLHGVRRAHARQWLEGLNPVDRSIFVLRATADFSSEETAELLGPIGAGGWTPEAVSEVYRAGLCSLASQVLHQAARN